MMGLIGKRKLCAKFEIAGFNHCKNIKENAKFLGPLHTMATPLLSIDVILLLDLANSSSLLNLKSPASAITKILQGIPETWGAPIAQGYYHFSSGCDFMMGLGKPQQ